MFGFTRRGRTCRVCNGTNDGSKKCCKGPSRVAKIAAQLVGIDAAISADTQRPDARSLEADLRAQAARLKGEAEAGRTALAKHAGAWNAPSKPRDPGDDYPFIQRRRYGDGAGTSES